MNDAFLGDWYLPPLDDLAAARRRSLRPRRASLRPLYDRILDLALAHAPLAVCVPPVLPDPFEEGGITERLARIGAMVAAAAAASGPGRACSIWRRPSPPPAAPPGRGFTIDGVHLSARGADVVAAAFRDLIARCASAGPPAAAGRRGSPRRPPRLHSAIMQAVLYAGSRGIR